MKKRLTGVFAFLLALVMVLSLTACGKKTSSDSDKKVLKLAANFSYASLDTHKDYYGWYTSIYGVTEALFKIGSNLSIEPCLAKSAQQDGKTWTIVLKDGVTFSNGNPLTADLAVRNLQRVGKVNERFSDFAGYTYKVIDDKTFTVTTPEIDPTLQNDIASPEFGMLDLDSIKDYDTGIIGTGPFVIEKFEPEGDVTVKKNTKYWDGRVKLDEVVFYYMQDDQSKLLAMQSGEIDGYDSVTSSAYQTYQKDPDAYSLSSVAGTRLQFYILNEKTLDDNIRAAINGTVDKEAISKYLSGTVSATDGPFKSSLAYGKVDGAKKISTADAKALIEKSGYTLNSDGIFEKNGKTLKINICYYAARSLDTLATLMQEQLKAIGIDAKLTVEEDPDATYISTGDFDIALYCMISDKYGDPYYFIDSTMSSGAVYNCGGFQNASCEKMIRQLQTETDKDKRAELANKIVQIGIDDNAFGYVGLFNKITVLKPGVSGYAADNPCDFYAVTADTDIA